MYTNIAIHLNSNNTTEISGKMIGGSTPWVDVTNGAINDYNYMHTTFSILFGGATQAELDAIVSAMQAPFDRQRREREASLSPEASDAIDAVMRETQNV